MADITAGTYKLRRFIEDGLITEEECTALDFGTNPEYCDYGALYESRYKALHMAYKRFVEKAEETEDFQAFVKENADWLDDYCLYMALKQENEGKPWSEWEAPYRNRDKKAMAVLGEVISQTMDFFRFQQYEFMKQWKKVRAYAHKNGISISGDIPIYVAFDSADTWSHPEMFQFDEDNIPISVAGCPPDAFSATGQLWGNPLYDWAYLKKNGYKWWIRRIERCLEFYDVIRIDHFRGFDEYYAVPFGEETADYCVSWVLERGLIDEESYAAAIVRHYSAKGCGAGRIRQELQRRGIPRELLDEALASRSGGTEKLDGFIAARLKNPDDRDEVRKLSAALYRRGFSSEEIRAALDRARAAYEYED